MKQHFRTFFFTLFACALLSASCSAAFSTVREYTPFSDVASSHWSQPYVQRCYELGLMSGTSSSTYSPSGSVSVAQGIMVAVRLMDLEDGGDGVIDQSGATWYENALNLAMKAGLVSPDQFDSYTRPATRAELAGLLANALPKSHYKAINSIKELPDVDAYTPYSEEIFRLYNAGILSGGDAYGTYSPYNSITRAELSAILCRLVEPSTRLTLKLSPKPADLTVYSTDKIFYIEDIPLPGVVRIDGEYYIAADVIWSTASPFGPYSFFGTYGDDDNFDYYWSPSYSTYKTYAYAPLTVRPVGGRVIGKADPEPKSLDVYEKGIIDGAVYTIDGRYPMASLSAIGAVARGNDFFLDVCDEPTNTVVEEDLLGTVLPSLQRATTRDTLLAIHDYIVNLMTHLDAFREGTSAQEAAWNTYSAAAEKYQVKTNVSVACGYGVCQDYAELFDMMCARSGIPCHMVTGANHAWNRVYVDGKWQFMDCTYDDPVGGKPVLLHDYFLVDADVMVRSHYWEDSDYPMPKTYDPAWEQLDHNNITSPDMFRKCLVAQVAKAPFGTSTVTLRTTRSGSYGGYHCLFAYPESYFWRIYGGHSGGGVYTYTIDR